MSFQVRAFGLPKAGNAPEEYEDAWAGDPAAGRFAIADGATESSFAAPWARSLVEGFVQLPPAWSTDWADELRAWLAPPQQRWAESIDWTRLPWYAEEKARAGAFSSLLGLEFESIGPVGGAGVSPAGCPGVSPAGRPEVGPTSWRALAVGDSGLFQVRGGTLRVAFPVERAADFGSRPALLSSRPERNQRLWEQVQTVAGTAQPGDLFLLATDALAQWILARVEAGAEPWAALRGLEEEADFAAFVADLRSARAIRNDDTTLVRVSG